MAGASLRCVMGQPIMIVGPWGRLDHQRSRRFITSGFSCREYQAWN